MERFYKDMTIFEALRLHVKANDIFLKYGMGCQGCMGAQMETMKNAARMHGIDIANLLRDLNELFDSEEPSSSRKLMKASRIKRD
ncbi:MAG: DUF1858 domain-containing protein [Bacillota bacterium]